MANPLYSVPGLGGFLASQDRRRAMGQQDMEGNIQQMKLADLLNAQKDEQQLKQVMGQTGGDPTKAMQALLAAGTPKSIELAAKLDGLIKRPQQPKWTPVERYNEKTGMPEKVLVNENDPTQIQPFGGQKASEPPKPDLGTSDMQNAGAIADTMFDRGTPEWKDEFKKQIISATANRGTNVTTNVGESKAPTTRVIQSGNQKITQEWVNGKWNTVAISAEKTPAQLLKEEQGLSKAAEQEEKANKLKDLALVKAKIVIQKANDALKKTGFFTTGLTGAVLSKIPGREAYDLDKTIDTIKANIGFQELADMRAASPTGGALGQITVREIEFLQATIASLDSGLSYEEKVKAISQIKTHYENWVNAIEGKETTPASPTSPSAPKTKAYDRMPNPKDFAGKFATDTETGIKYKSNGRAWEKQ